MQLGTRGQVEGLSGVTALAWPPHGGRLAVGTLAGRVALADAFLARSRHAGDLRITRVSRSLALAQRLSDGAWGAAAQAHHAGVGLHVYGGSCADVCRGKPGHLEQCEGMLMCGAACEGSGCKHCIACVLWNLLRPILST